MGGQAKRKLGLAQVRAMSATAGFSQRTVDVYRLELRLHGDTEGESIHLPSVLVAAVPNLPFPFLLGRAGALERLELELDFPQSRVVLTDPTSAHPRYPSLSREFPSLPSITLALSEGKFAQAVRELSWEMEKFAERLLAEERAPMAAPLEWAGKARPQTVRSMSLSDKLTAITSSRGVQGLESQIRDSVQARNVAVHAPSFDLDRRATESLLETAETVVSRLTLEPHRRVPNKRIERTS